VLLVKLHPSLNIFNLGVNIMAKLGTFESVDGVTHVFSFDYNDLKDSNFLNSSNQRAIAKQPRGACVEMAYAVEDVAFAGGTPNVVIDVGTTTGDPDEYINAFDVDGSTTGVPAISTGDLFTGNQSQPVGGAAAETDILLEVTGDDYANLTAGRCVIALRIIDPLRHTKNL
jgi:hypothetical protein